jgi:multiple sugar transport system permease protein
MTESSVNTSAPVTRVSLQTVADQYPEPKGKPSQTRSRVRSVLKHTALILFGLVMLYPLLWMVASSFKPDALIFREPGLIPTEFTTSNYTDGWNALLHPFHHYLLNSAIIVFGSVLGNLVACSMAAYAFARLKFRGRNLWFAIMLM